MFCQNCGNKLEQNALFCSACGEKAAIIEPAIAAVPVSARGTEKVVKRKISKKVSVVVSLLLIAVLCIGAVVFYNAPYQGAKSAPSLFAEIDNKVYFLDSVFQEYAYDMGLDFFDYLNGEFDYEYNLVPYNIVELDIDNQSVKTLSAVPLNLTGEVQAANDCIYYTYTQRNYSRYEDVYTGGVMELNPDTGEQRKLIEYKNAICFGLQILEDSMYYITFDIEKQYGILHKYNLNGAGSELVYNSNEGKILVEYYVHGKMLYLVTWDNDKEKISISKVQSGNADEVILATIYAPEYELLTMQEKMGTRVKLGEQIYYFEEAQDGSFTINKLNPKSGKITPLITECNKIWNFVATRNWIYFQDRTNSVDRLRNDGTKSATYVIYDHLGGSSNNWVYVQEKENRRVIGFSKINSKRVEIIPQNKISWISVKYETQGWIFGTGVDLENDLGFRYFMCRPDGSDFKWIT